MENEYQGEYDSIDSLIFQDKNNPYCIEIKEIFDGDELNMKKLEEFKNRPDINQNLIDQILEMQRKINRVKKERDLLIQDQSSALNQSQMKSQQERIYTHWTHEESQVFIQAVEEFGRNNEKITNYLQRRGINKQKSQVISHSQKFFNKLKKIITDGVKPLSREQLKHSYKGLQPSIDKIKSVNGADPNLPSETTINVLSLIYALIKATMGSITVAATQYVDFGSQPGLTYEQIIFLVKNHTKYID